MAKILRQNVDGVAFTMAGCALTGVCPTAAADYVKQITLSDGDVIEDGMMMVVTFANGNSAGNAPGTKTIYSSDQVNYFEDDQLTVPFTLAPAGCYEIEYTGTANAYTYTDYPVFQVGSVSGPVCDYRGHITSGDLWNADDSVQCIFKEGKFLLLGGSGSADAGAGNPVGTIIPMYKKSNPSGYLYCDGRDTTGTSEELSAHYPILYAILGSNKLPDYREFALVGAEENTTDVYNASTNPTGTIREHDIYTQGQAKDDCLQDHRHSTNGSGSGNTGIPRVAVGPENAYTGAVYGNVRTGSVTRGKRKAVFFYIKATSGLSENAQDNVVAQLNEERSYSTTEHATGKKWIDGKPIYQKVIDLGNLPNATVKRVNTNITDLARVVSLQGMANIANTDYFFPLPLPSKTNVDEVVNMYYFNSQIVIESGVDRSTWIGVATIEYTKTTD